MNYANIKNFDIANGEGVRVSLFVSGCTNHCEECFQPETWNFQYGTPFTEQTKNEILNMLNSEHIHGLSILGGEPFEPTNQEILLPFIYKVKEQYPDKTIWIFSGFTYEELTSVSYANCKYTDKILSLIDILVDGRYDKTKRDLSLKFRGSSNQRIIDVKQTRSINKIVLWDKI